MPRMLELIRDGGKAERKKARSQAEVASTLASQFTAGDFWRSFAKPFIDAYIEEGERVVLGKPHSEREEDFIRGCAASLRDFLGYVNEMENFHAAVLEREREEKHLDELDKVSVGSRSF